MARISKSGIIDGSTIQSEHLTRIIDALDGTGSAEISATGSFTGSFTGNGSQLTGIVSTTATSASYAETASFLTGTIDSASFASTASYVNRLAQNVIITGSLTLSGSSATSLSVFKTSNFQGTSSFNSIVNLSGKQYELIKTVTTTDTTQTDIWSRSLPANNAYVIEATIIGISGSTGYGDAVYTVGGNVVGLVRANSLSSNVTGQSSSSFDNFGAGTPTFGISAGGVGSFVTSVWVKGLASTEIDWEASIKWTSITARGGA